MRISAPSTLRISVGGSGNMSALVRQIKNLEKMKKKLMEQLGVPTKSGTGSISDGFIALSGLSGGDAQSDKSTSFPMTTPATTGSSSDSMEWAADLDPKEVMKLVMQLESQIMTLKQQLSDEEKAQLAHSGDADDQDGSHQAFVTIASANTDSSAPAAAVTTDAGQVDAYA